MVSYYIGVGSRQDHKLEIIEQIVRLPTLGKILFPAKIANPPIGYIDVAASQDFKISLISQVFYHEISVGCTLHSDKGIEFNCTINLLHLPTPNRIILEFTDEHLKESLVSYTSLRQTIIELVTVFQADFAVLTDKAMWKHEGGRRYWNGPNKHYFPMEVGWVTYFGPRLVTFIGRKKMSNLRRFHQKIEVDGGYVLVLQEEPFVADDEKMRIRAQKALGELGLKRYER